MEHYDWDLFLVFRDPRLEEAFWSSASVRRTLLRLDRLALFCTFLDTLLMKLLFSQTLDDTIMRLHNVSIVLLVVPVLVVNGLTVLWQRPDAFYRHSSEVMAVHRVVRILALYMSSFASAHLNLPSGALRSPGGAPSSYFLLAKTLLLTHKTRVGG